MYAVGGEVEIVQVKIKLLLYKDTSVNNIEPAETIRCVLNSYNFYDV